MKHRALDLFLFVLVAIGGGLAWQSGRERSRLTAEHARLAPITGDLPVEDPSKVYVRALETGDPMHFAWRVYCPPNYKGIVDDKCFVLGGASLWTTSSSDFIARVVFRHDQDGQLEIFTHFDGGSQRSGFADQTLAELLRGHWQRIRVEQLGAPELAILGPNQSAILLRLTLPDDLRDEARKKLPAYTQEHHVPVLLELTVGPRALKP